MKNNIEIVSVRELQNKILDIAVKIQNEFRKNNINIFIHSGTLLGAIREKGFIAWDDDIDFAVDYKEFHQNFSKIKDVLEKMNLNYSKNFFKWYKNVADAFFIKTKEFYLVKNENNYYLTKITIDIIMCVSTQFMNSEILSKRYWKKVARKYPKFIYTSKNPFGLMFNPLVYKIKLLSSLKKYEKANYNDKNISLLYQWTYRKDIFNRKMKNYTFDNKTLIGPSNGQEVLATSFGENWKTPKVEKNHFQKYSKIEIKENDILKRKGLINKVSLGTKTPKKMKINVDGKTASVLKY